MTYKRASSTKSGVQQILEIRDSIRLSRRRPEGVLSTSSSVSTRGTLSFLWYLALLCLYSSQWPLLRYGRNVDPRGLYAEQYRLGFGQVEGCVQSQVDFRA